MAYTVVMQALILIGGQASRLKADGVTVPLSKAFLSVQGKPLLFWNLSYLYAAGVRNLVFVGDTVIQLHRAQRVVWQVNLSFNEVRYFCDEGNGAHGVPYELRYLLEDVFIFECGHAISTPEHYHSLIRSHKPGCVVFSAYTPGERNIRQPVLLEGGWVKIDSGKSNGVIAHPIVASREYANSLLSLQFQIQRIVRYYASQKRMRYVMNTLPPEFDLAEEMRKACGAYNSLIACSATM